MLLGKFICSKKLHGEFQCLITTTIKRRVNGMSRFYASIQGNRGGATRQGTPGSGITGHIRGWRIGARAACLAIDDKDVVRIWLTGGSSGRKSDILLAEVFEDTGVLYLIGKAELKRQMKSAGYNV